MMSETENCENTADVDRPAGWWGVTYLLNALALGFTFVATFPVLNNFENNHLFDITFIFGIFIFSIGMLSIFIIRKWLLLTSFVLIVFLNSSFLFLLMYDNFVKILKNMDFALFLVVSLYLLYSIVPAMLISLYSIKRVLEKKAKA